MARISTSTNITKFSGSPKGHRLRKGLRIYQRHSIRPYGVVENAMQIALLFCTIASFAFLASNKLGLTYITLMISSLSLLMLHIAAKFNWKNARSTRSSLKDQIQSSWRHQKKLRMKSHERRARHFPNIEEAFINAGLFSSPITDKDDQTCEPRFHADTKTPLLGEMDTCNETAKNQPIIDENTVYENYSITVRDIDQAFYKAGLIGRDVKSCESISMELLDFKSVDSSGPHHIGSLKAVGQKTKGSKHVTTRNTSRVAEEVS